MRIRLHHLLVLAGVVAGLAAGVFVIDTDPAVFGWLFGLGAGLAGGAFLAAITSGEQLAGGGSERGGRRRPNPALQHWERDRDHIPSTNGRYAHTPRGSESRDRPE